MRFVKRALGYLGVFVFLAATTAGLWLPPIISHATEKDYWFPEVRIDATLGSNGDLQLVERRTFDFRNGPFTYAYFNVDDPADHVRDFSISEIEPDGTEVPVRNVVAGHSIVTDGFQAQWFYDANDEERTWVFRYTVVCAALVYRDTSDLYWQFIGTGWEEPTGHAVITVHLPPKATTPTERPATCDPDRRPAATVAGTPLTRGDVRAFGHGPLNGTVTFPNPSTVVYDVHDIPPAAFVEGSILLPTTALPNAPIHPVDELQAILAQERRWADQANALRSRHETERSWVIALLLLMPVVMALLVAVARLRDRVPGVPRTIEQPPDDDAVAGALLWSAWKGSLQPQNAYRAQLLRLARLGAVEMRAEGLVTAPTDITLVRKVDAMDLPTVGDQDFLWLIFGRGEDAADEVSIRHPKRRKQGPIRYDQWYDAVKTRSGGLLRRIQKGDARVESVAAFVVAIGAAGYGLWTRLFGLAGPIGWWLVLEAVPALVIALILIPARLGLEDRTKVMRLAAFRRYLKDFSDLPNAPALAVVIWEQYLEWAVALDVAREVEKQVTAIVPVETLRSPVPGGPSGLAGIQAFHSFESAGPALVMTSMAGISSGASSGGFGSSASSSGFSSGGFSSGGGGGGGGTGGGAG